MPFPDKISLGAAIYPTLALLNHSCNPDFMRCNRGKGVVCVANRDIKKGSEVWEFYIDRGGKVLRQLVDFPVDPYMYCFLPQHFELLNSRGGDLRELRAHVHGQDEGGAAEGPELALQV